MVKRKFQIFETYQGTESSMAHNMTFVGLLASTSSFSPGVGQSPSWPQYDQINWVFWHTKMAFAFWAPLECTYSGKCQMGCWHAWLKRPPVSCGQGCFGRILLLERTLSILLNINLSNRNLIVYRSEMVFRESDTRTERALVLNAFIMCLVPAGMSCRHKSLETVVSWELVSSDHLMASFSHCSLHKSVRPGVLGGHQVNLQRTDHIRDSLLIIFS